MRFSLNTQILAGALAGILAGIILGHAGLPVSATAPCLAVFVILGHTFIWVLKIIVVPLIFTSITTGIANLAKTPGAGRVWPVLLGYSLTTTAIAVATGLAAVNLFKPGEGADIHSFMTVTPAFHAHAASVSDLGRMVFQSIFTNPANAIAHTNILAIVVFAVICGLAVAAVNTSFPAAYEIISDIFHFILAGLQLVMRLAPLGVMGLLAVLTAEQNLSLLPVMGTYMGVVFAATLLHGALTLPLILWVFTRIRPGQFFRAMREALVTAFSTSSSAATLPVSLRCVVDHLNVDKHIAGFVLPVGAALNMDGTALYEAIAALFVANLTGIHLGLGQQITVALTAMLASIGAPGIPSAGMVTMIMVLQSVGLPAEAVALLIPIDRPLDTFRTAVNVEGDCIGACIVDRSLRPRP